MQNILKSRLIKTGIIMTALVFSFAAPGNLVQAATGVNVETHTQEEIRSYIKNNGGDINQSPVYADAPVTSAPYAAGSLSEETLQNALAVLNGVRYIAGIPYNVILDTTYTSKVQAGTLINYVNKQLTHSPVQPSGMSDELYQWGCSGTGSSNIEGGSGTSGRPLGTSIVSGWMGDGDSSNIDRVGHRRWCLNPSMGKTGFGSVWGPNGCYSAMYSFDKSNTSAGASVVPWPAQNMPTEYFAVDSPWSISRQAAFDSGTTVKLTRISDQRVWNFTSPGTTGEDGYYNISNAGYGQTGCLIFRPSGITGYYEGDGYHVQVTENGQVVIDYTVDFFAIDSVASDVTVQLSASSGKINVATDSYYWSGPTITLSDPSVSFSKLSVVSSDEDVVKAMIKTENTGSGYLYLRGIKDGVATVTIALSKNAYAVYTVTVGDGGGHTHVYSQEYTIYETPACSTSGKKARFCTCGEKTDDTIIPATGVHSGGTATCLEKAKCAVCGKSYGELAEHISGSWIVDTVATEELEGSRHKECVVCYTELERESIPKLQEGEDQEQQKPDDISGSNPSEEDKGSSDSKGDFVDSEPVRDDIGDKSENQDSVLGKTQVIAGSSYKVTADSTAGRTVTYMGFCRNASTGKVKEIKIPGTVKIGNRTYKVTAIAANAFKNNRVLKKITIPASVKSIGTKAFYGCRSLKTITVKTKKLTSKSVGKSAFKGIAKKAVIKVPKSRLKAYKKFLKKKGVPSKAVIRK